MADRRGIIVPLVILTFIFLSPDPGRRPINQIRVGPSFDDVIAEEQRSLSVLQNSTYSPTSNLTASYESGLNLTGLAPESGYAWDALQHVRTIVQGQLEYAFGGGERAYHAMELKENAGGDALPLYKNVTGFIHGSWVRSKVNATILHPHLNMSEYAPIGPFGPLPPRDFRRNITGDGGDIRIRFHERPSPSAKDIERVDGLGNVTSMDVDMTITDTSTFEEHDLRLMGVYFPSAGQAVLTTTSEKFAGIFALPHLTLSESMFEASRNLLNDTISKTIKRQIDGDNVRLNPWSTRHEGTPETAFTTPECEMVVYLQQLPAPLGPASTASSVMSFLENEMRFPTGAFIPGVPDLQFTMTAFSPDCGYVLESKGPPEYAPQEGTHLLGPKLEIMIKSSRNHLLVFNVALALQVALLLRQMREASTPSTRSRVSLYAIAMLSLGDGFTFISFLLISFFIGGLWVNLMSTAFLAFMSVSFLGMRFLMDIWTVQAPERAVQEREEAEAERQREERMMAALQRIRERQAAELAARNNAAAPPQTNTTGEANATTTSPPGSEQTTTANNIAPPAQDNTTTNSTNLTTTTQPPATQPATQLQPQTLPGSLPPPTATQPPVDTGATPIAIPANPQGPQPLLPLATMPAMPTTGIPRQTFGALYTRFYILLIALIFLSLNAAGWPAAARRFYFTLLAFIYLGFWLPQIRRNVLRNCRHALNWEFVIGQSVLRLVPFAYFYGYKDNAVFAELDYPSLAFLAIWVWLQVLVLGSQEIVGPRWFIRKHWAPPAYDYHPVLREDEEGATMPIGFSQATAAGTGSTPTSPTIERRRSDASPTTARRGSVASKETREKGKRVFDCAICMQDLEVPVIESGTTAGDNNINLTGPAGLLARRTYMVTPCRHIFHSACLEGWMKYRLQCPICRESLPPL